MNNGSTTMPNVIDWGELILEAQTAPSGVGTSEAFGLIYINIYGYMTALSRKWLETHHLSEAQDEALIAVGLELIIKQLPKYKVPDYGSARIFLAFKAWVSICCEREWGRRKNEFIGTTPDGTAASHIQDTSQSTHPSPEELLYQAECNPEGTIQPSCDRGLKKNIIREELEKIPNSMRNAILETMDIKEISNMNSRGKTGEAFAIAVKHGHKPNAVKTRTHRLKEKVKARYEKEGP